MSDTTAAFEADVELDGERLDGALARELSISRARARRLIDSGSVAVDGAQPKPSHRLRSGERVTALLAPAARLEGVEPEAIPLDVRFEDAHLIVIDKPAGLVVHPAPGHARGTLVHALLHHCEQLSGIGGVERPGIVHRLDKGTSGLMVVAKDDPAHRGLAEQFRAHRIGREYQAIARGRPRADQGEIDASIGRHPRDGKRFSTRSARRSREARTRWKVAERARDHALLRVRPQTGRTHQIRVHLASIGLPILGDPLYGGGRFSAPGLARQALHAAVLVFEHPLTGEKLRFKSNLPDDIARVWAELPR